MDFKFNPENKFIEHPDPQHKYSLDKQEFDFEYQSEFRNFILNALKESNVDVSDEFAGYFDTPSSLKATESEPRSVYIESSELLKEMIVSEDPESRLRLCRELEEEFFIKFSQDIKSENLSREELEKLITETFLEEIDIKKLISLMKRETDIAKKNILSLVIQIIDREAIPKTNNEVEVNKSHPYSMDVPGTCAKAERHMLAYISGAYGNSTEWSHTNVIIDNDNNPLMIEKVGELLGDSHSCISLRPVRIDGVLIPAGAIFASNPVSNRLKKEEKISGGVNYIQKLDEYYGFVFLRMSLFSLPEKIRASAGGSYYSRQYSDFHGYINHDWVTPEIIAEYAKYRIEKIRKIE